MKIVQQIVLAGLQPSLWVKIKKFLANFLKKITEINYSILHSLAIWPN